MTIRMRRWRRVCGVSTHMPLARHDKVADHNALPGTVSTHMPLARHDTSAVRRGVKVRSFLLTCLLRGMTIW